MARNEAEGDHKGSQPLIVIPPGSFIFNAQIATPHPLSGYLAEPYVAYSVYLPFRDTVEYRVYGAGSDGIFLTRDDTGDRSVQSMHSSLGGGAKHTSAFGNSIEYILSDNQGTMIVVVKGAGNDGYLGLGGDDTTSLLAASTTIPFLNREFDIVANGNVFPIARDPVIYLIRQPLTQNQPQRNEVVNVDTPASTNDGNVGYFQTTLSGITSYQETAPAAQDVITWFLAPGPNGMFESVASPGYDDQRYAVGRTLPGHNEGKGQLAYDASHAITISSYPQPSSDVVNVYDFRPAGSNNGELRFLPAPTTVPLQMPYGFPSTSQLRVGRVDIDGAFISFPAGPNLPNIPPEVGSLAISYSYISLTGPQFNAIQSRRTGRDGIFMTNDDYVRTDPLPPGSGERIEDLNVKEDKYVLVGRIGGVDGIFLTQC